MALTLSLDDLTCIDLSILVDQTTTAVRDETIGSVLVTRLGDKVARPGNDTPLIRDGSRRASHVILIHTNIQPTTLFKESSFELHALGTQGQSLLLKSLQTLAEGDFLLLH